MKIKSSILVVTGTRAEYGLLRPVISVLKKRARVAVKVLVTGMHTLEKYGQTIKEVAQDTTIDAVVPVTEEDSMPVALAKEIVGIEAYLKKNKINYILVLGDRDEPLAAALVGVHIGIPIIHISGGDVSGPTVDNHIRNAISVCAQLHLVQTKSSKANVIRLVGQKNKKQIKVVGSLGLDGIANNLLSRTAVANALGLDVAKPWFLVVFHPTPLDVTPLSQQISSVIDAIHELPLDAQKIILYPNNDTGAELFIAKLNLFRKEKNWFIKPHLERSLFLSLLSHSSVLIGNSSCGLIEAAFFKTPNVLVGNRQQGRETGLHTIPVGYVSEEIMRAVRIAQSPVFIAKLKKIHSPYVGGAVAEKVVKSIEQFIEGYDK